MQDHYFQNLALKTLAQHSGRMAAEAKQKSKSFKKLETDLNKAVEAKQSHRDKKELGDILDSID